MVKTVEDDRSLVAEAQLGCQCAMNQLATEVCSSIAPVNIKARLKQPGNGYFFRIFLKKRTYP